MDCETRLFINNEYVSSTSGETISVTNPATDELVTDQVQVAGREDVDKAVDAAKTAFKTWKTTPTGERAAIMLKYADLLEANTEKIVELEVAGMGMPLMIARAMVASQVTSFRYYAGFVDKVPGETYNEDGDGQFRMITYHPLGVCAGISAWNAVNITLGWKIAPAIAMGNTFVHKSSERNPLSCCFMGQLVKEAGFPPGVINLLSGGPATGELLVSHMGIAKISFTGSVAVGRKVQVAAAQSNLKQVSLELGGKSASIVFEDADIPNAVKNNSQLFVANNAQGCSAASRVLVHENIAPAFIEGMKQAFSGLAYAIGDPSSEQTFLGPLADRAQLQRVQGYIDEAKAGGIEVLVGGEGRPGPGQYCSPTLFLNPGLDSRIWKEEIFGPVLMIRTFKTEEEAIELANDTEYGLSGIIFTANIGRAIKVAAQIDVGTFSINGSHWPTKFTSWGGWKQSGYGRESGLAGIKQYVQSKAVHIHLGEVQVGI